MSSISFVLSKVDRGSVQTSTSWGSIIYLLMAKGSLGAGTGTAVAVGLGLNSLWASGPGGATGLAEGAGGAEATDISESLIHPRVEGLEGFSG